MDPKNLTTKAKVYQEHPVSGMADLKYVPEYQEKSWNSPELYKMFLDEEWARLRTRERHKRDGHKAIVHVKAQHMLKLDGTPGPELEERLWEALIVGRALESCAWGLEKEVIYVTSGAIHAGCDHTTLADASANWLIEHGVKSDHIVRHVDLKNGNDEDYQVCAMLEADEEISEVHVVCSLGQFARSLLCFLSRGWLPYMHPITYLGLDSREFGAEEPDAWTLDALRPHQSIIAELRGEGFGIAPFFAGADAVRASEEAATRRHEAEIGAMKSQHE